MQRSQTPTTQRPHRTSAPPRRTEGNVTKNGTWEVPCTAFKRSSGTAVARDLQGRFLGPDSWLPASGVGRPGTTAEGAPVTHYALGTPGAGRGGATRTALTRIITARLLSSTGTSAPTRPGTAAAASETAVPGRDFTHACTLQKEVPPPCGSYRLIGTVQDVGGKEKAWLWYPAWPALSACFII